MAVKQLPITTDKTRLHSNCFLANILLVAVKQLPITTDKTRLHSNCFLANNLLVAVQQLHITRDKTRLHSNCFLANILLVAVKQLPITTDKTRLHSNCFIANILLVAVKQLLITSDKTRLHSNCFLANILQVFDTLGFNISITPCKRFACVLLMFHFLRRYKLTEYTYVNKRHISCSVLHVACEEMDIPPNCLFGYLYTVEVCMSGGEIIN